MEYATPDKILPWCTCLMAAFVMLALYAGTLHYKFWQTKLRGGSFSSVHQRVQLCLWLLGVAIVCIYSVVVLWLFGYYFQLLVELFEE
jgi:hypothetical protein